jgi:ribosomal protein L11 methyltransferase
MSQNRLFVRMGRASSAAVFDALGAAFEEDGFPVAVTEIDEDRDIQEISVYAGDDAAEVETRLRELLAGHAVDTAIGCETLPDTDWVAKSLEGLKPVRAGRFLVHGAHDRAARRIGDIGIEIEAGLAFGTGHHGTTAGCLKMLETVVRRETPRNALDLGTGSGVLAIAIALMARIPVLATDIDPIATEVAAANARLNRAAAYVAARTAGGFHHPVFATAGPFDLIVANILAKPLMQLAPRVARHLSPGGSLVLSGILDRQRDQVVAAYATQKFRHVRTTHREGWVTIHFKR